MQLYDLLLSTVTGTPVDADMASAGTMEVAVADIGQIGQPPACKKSNPSVQHPPFPTLLGEHPLLLSKTTEGNAMVTNFRFCVCERRSLINVPLMAIGELQVTEAYCWLRLACKDGATYSCTFATAEDCQACYNLLRQRTGLPQNMKDLFAFQFYCWTTFKGSFQGSFTASEAEQIALCQPVPEDFGYTFGKEVTRQGFDTSKKKIWRICLANEKFEYCPTYPKYHIMPATIDDPELRRSLDFRALKRFPSVVWRDKQLGVVLIRSSQPMSSFLGLSYFSNQADIALLEKIVEACHKEREAIEEEFLLQSGRALMDANGSTATASATAIEGDNDSASACRAEDGGAQGSLVAEGQGHGASNGNGAAHHSNGNNYQHKLHHHHNNNHSGSNAYHSRLHHHHHHHHRYSAASAPDAGKLAIVDCRSVAGMWGNSLKGGGTEDEAVYKCSIFHLDLANIHTVRDSFNKLRALCHTYAEGTYFKTLSGCMWLTYIAALLRGANMVVDLIQAKRRPVLVHCSDGWDRTSQICSLSELMMDKYYRTIEGFQVLVEREWLHFGHKFAERGGHDPNCSDTNQMSPIFLQFLDCVYQLSLQYPAEFQFNEAYLVKLLRHSQACMFGTFLHNCDRERQSSEPTASVWVYLRPDNPQFINLLYKPTHEILTAKYGEHDVILWKNVYMAGLSPWLHSSQTDFHMEGSMLASATEDSGETAAEGITRSKSMDDLSRANADGGRRNSDPQVHPPGIQPDSCAASSSAAAAVGEEGPAVAGSRYDTTSSSTEILNYPEEGHAGQGRRSVDAKASGSDGNKTPHVVFCSGEADGKGAELAGKEDVTSCPPEAGKEEEQVQGSKGENTTTDSNQESPCIQDLGPTSSSVLSGQPEQQDDHTGNGSCSEQTACHASNSESSLPAQLPVVETTAATLPDSSVMTTTPATDISTVTRAADCQGLSLTQEETSSFVTASSSLNPSLSSNEGQTSQRGLSSEETSLASFVSAASSSNGQGKFSPAASEGQGSQAPVGVPLTVVSKPSPSSSLSPSPSSRSPQRSSPPALQNGKYSFSLLSERLASPDTTLPSQNTETAPAPSMNCHSPVSPDNELDSKHSQHSGRVVVDGAAAKLKSACTLSDSDRKDVTLPGSVSESFSHGVKSLSPKAWYQNGSSLKIEPMASGSKRPDTKLNGASVDHDGPVTVTESTDTLTEQPVAATPRRRSSGSNRSYSSGSSNGCLTATAKGAGGASVSPTSCSPLGLRSGTPSPQAAAGRQGVAVPSSPQYPRQSRRARAVSGGGRDLSVSPSNSWHGAWTDTGRLRHPSGGGAGEMAVARSRMIGATVATSTSDISDSFVGKPENNRALAIVDRSPSVKQHLDIDGLTQFCDERQDLLTELVAEKDRRIIHLESQLRQAIDIIRANRERQQQQQLQQQQQQQSLVPTSGNYINGHLHHAGMLEELLMTEMEGGEPSSIGALSNAASDNSWENIEETEERIVMWVPDSTVTHCAGCDSEFWVAKRKHHCRNCGKVFCWECSNYLAPVPHQHLNKPERVCRRCHASLLQLSPGASSDGRIPTLVADG